MHHLPLTTFRRCVARYAGEHKVKSFSCLDQYLCMAFAQLTFRESLRDIEASLRAPSAKLYHLGIRGHVRATRSPTPTRCATGVSMPNFAELLIGVARSLYADEPFGVELAADRLCPRLHHHRSVPGGVSLGAFSSPKMLPSNCTPCSTCRAIFLPLSSNPRWQDPRCFTSARRAVLEQPAAFT